MPDLPNSLALTTIADDAEIIASSHRNNYSAISTAVNALITALTGGTSGQFLRATDTDTVAMAYPPGYEFAHIESTAVFNFVAGVNTEAAPLDIVSAGSVTFDGSTSVIVEGFFPRVAVGAGAGTAQLGISLWDTTDQGRMGFWTNNAAVVLALGGVLLRRKVTPSAGAHTYKLRGWAVTANASVNSGAGGVGVEMPAYIRITKA